MALSWTTHSLPGLNVSGRSTTLTMILFHSGRRSMSVSNPKTSLAGLDTVAAAVPVPPIPSFLSLRFAGKEAVTEHLVCPGLLLTLRTAERVDWLTDTDAGEGLHRPVGQRVDDRPVVPEARGGNPTGVEVVRRVRRRRDAAV